MKKTFTYEGRKISLNKLETAQLKEMGVSDEGIRVNYSGTDYNYYTDGTTIYETLDNHIEMRFLSTEVFINYMNTIIDIED